MKRNVISAALLAVLLAGPAGPARADGSADGEPYPADPSVVEAPPPQPCPDYGSYAIVEAPQPRGTPRGPVIVQSWNPCADLPPPPGQVQPRIGIDVLVAPRRR